MGKEGLMPADYPTGTEPATPEYVFSYFEAIYRQALSIREAHPDQSPTFDTTVKQYMDSCLAYEGMSWAEFAAFWNKTLQTNVSMVELEATVSPAERRTLRDLCQLLAARSSRPIIRAWPGLGVGCAPAGAFLTVRDMLSEMGANTAAVSPATEIEPALRKYKFDFVNRLLLLAPERVPDYKIVHHLDSGACGLFLLGFLFLAGTLPAFLIYPPAGGITTMGFIGFFIAAVLAVWIGSWLPPKSIGLGSLRTFRDLAYCLAGEEPRRRDRRADTSLKS
jgi:hypothetical protein